MELPIKFPTEKEVIDDEVARFRALSPAARRASIRGLLDVGYRMMRMSPRAAYMRQYTADQEEIAQRAFREFVAKHGE